MSYWRANQDALLDAGIGPEDADEWDGRTDYTWSITVDGDAAGCEISSATHDWSYTIGKDGASWVVQLPNYAGGPIDERSFGSQREATLFAMTALLDSYLDGDDDAAAAERSAERAYGR